MLIEFRVENHRSIRDEQALTLEAGRSNGEDDPRPRAVAGLSKKILPVAAIYGANASGKSNVLSALTFMRDAVVHSSRHWAPDRGIPQEGFAWGKKSTEPTTYEVTFTLKSIRYQYGFRLDRRAFLEEWLFAWPNHKKQVWFERDNETFKFGENLRGENKLIEEMTRPNALFLSVAAQLKHPQLSSILTWFSEWESVNVLGRSQLARAYQSDYMLGMLLDSSLRFTSSVFGSEEARASLREDFRSLLKNADVGIEEIRASEGEDGSAWDLDSYQFELKHVSESEGAWLPLEKESRGTQALFRLALPVLRAIQWGSPLVVDELESSMHPNLAAHILRQFNDPALNPRNAQLIFSTHDTNLLGSLVREPALRRDQVWLTEKDKTGATVLYPLTDFKPRKGENLERGYVQGRYGAIPYLGDFRVQAE